MTESVDVCTSLLFSWPHFSLSTYRSAREWRAEYAAQHAEVEDAGGKGNDSNEHYYDSGGICSVRETPPDEGEAGDGAEGAAGTRGQELRKTALSKRHCNLEWKDEGSDSGSH